MSESSDTNGNGNGTASESARSAGELSVKRKPTAESLPAPSDERQRPAVVPPIDIYDSGEGLVLVADLPGVSGDTVDVQVQDNKLTLFGRLVGAVPEDAQPIHREFLEADFLRSFILSDDVDHDRIEASMSGGVLTVKLPRVERAKPRKIDVRID